MVGTNKVLRQYREANDRRKALADLGLQSQTIENLLARIPDGRTRGFEQFSLANSSANIRRLKQQLKAALVLANTCKDWGWEQGEVLAKVEDGRVWLVFPGKPDAETISRLKRSAFKWSPSRTAWVRADTQAARWAANQFKVAA